VSRDDHFGRELLQGADGVRDDRLEQRAVQLEPGRPGLTVAETVRTLLPTTISDDEDRHET
jgi:hypothetical protein